MTIEQTFSAPLGIDARARPAAGGQRLSQWRLFALILLGWQLLAVLEAFANYLDASHGAHPVLLRTQLSAVMPLYLPLVLNSWVLALAFARFQASILRPSMLLLTLLLSMAVFLPFLTGVDVLFMLLHDNLPLSDFPDLLAKGGRIAWWYNMFVVGLAFLAQTMATFWWRGQQQQISVQRARTEQLELRLGLLQGQLKPHFLFNALNTISALTRTADCALADQALGKLDELLNYALAAGKGKPPSVADELDFLRAYLGLQSLRYGDRMSVAWHIEQRDWTRHPCPPLLFQPLAENAVHHGVEPHQHSCNIDITLRFVAGMVCLRIANPVLADSRAGHGLGLNSTRERLSILYGQRADLTIDANDHSYSVHLRLPAHAP